MNCNKEEKEDVSNFSFHLTYSRIHDRYPPLEYSTRSTQTNGFLNKSTSKFQISITDVLSIFVCKVRIFSLSTPYILRISHYFIGLQMPFWPPLTGLKVGLIGSTPYTECLGKISEKVILRFVKIFRLSKNSSGAQTL